MWPFLSMKSQQIPVPMDVHGMLDPKDVSNALALLGSTPHEIATQLYHLDITGIPRDTKGCPIANFLRRRYNVTYVNVRQHIVSVKHIRIPTPGVIAEFIAKFDRGLYPDLIEVTVYLSKEGPHAIGHDESAGRSTTTRGQPNPTKESSTNPSASG